MPNPIRTDEEPAPALESAQLERDCLAPTPPGLEQATGFVYANDQWIESSLRNLPEFFQSMSNLFLNLSPDEIHCDGRFEYETPAGTNYCMPARIGNFSAMKWIRSCNGNPQRGLERSQSEISITDRDTGVLRFMLSGKFITPAKTALVTMLALESWITQESPESLRIGIIGGGRVSKFHVQAAHQIFGDLIGETRIYTPGNSGRELAAEMHDQYSTAFSPYDSLIRESNVIISSTTSPEPVVLPGMFSDSPDQAKFIAGVGFHDIHSELFDRAALIVSDDPISYSGSRLPLGCWTAELSPSCPSKIESLCSLMQGEVSIPTAPGRFTLFMPYGTAMADVVLCLKLLTQPIFEREDTIQ